MWVSHPLRTLVPSLDGAVLEAFAGTTLPLNASLIARIIDTGSPSGIRLVLKRLERDGLVKKDRMGRGYFIANRDHLLWPSIAEVVAVGTAWWGHVIDEVSAWEQRPESLALYGSVARGEDVPESDIDLLVVWPVHADEKDIGDLQHILGSLIEEWTGSAVQFYSVTTDTLRAHAQAQEPLFDEWTRDARTIVGRDIRGMLREAAHESTH